MSLEASGPLCMLIISLSELKWTNTGFYGIRFLVPSIYQLFLNDFILWKWLLCLHVCVLHHAWCPERAPDTLELELQTVANHYVDASEEA